MVWAASPRAARPASDSISGVFQSVETSWIGGARSPRALAATIAPSVATVIARASKALAQKREKPPNRAAIRPSTPVATPSIAALGAQSRLIWS